jgi:hypothetical protein
MFGGNLDLRSRTVIIAALIVAGAFLGYIYVNTSGKSTSTIVVRMDLEEGIVFDPATIHGAHTIGEILQNSTFMRSDTRIVLEARPVVTVTITFHDGSGYNVRVEISDWSVGDPVYSDEVVPPVLFREVVDKALNRTRSTP